MIPQLHKCAPALAIEFHVSIPSDVATTLLLLRAAQRYEGFDHWIYETASTLSGAFRQELDVLGYFVRWCLLGQDNLIWELPPDHPAHQDFDAFLVHLESQPAGVYQDQALLNLRQRVTNRGVDTRAEDAGATNVGTLLAAFKAQEVDRHGEDSVDLDPAAMETLLQDPEALRQRLLDLLRAFWETYYRRDLADNVRQMERCVSYHRRQDYPSSLRDVFRRVTGRSMTPEMRGDVDQHLDQIEQVFFIPASHIGPYFLFIADYPRLQVVFNHRLVPATSPAVTATTELFAPLKALADETRLQIVSLLQGRELYAQEIVEMLALSQPTVSRHLQLLERTGVLHVRRQNGMKYYSINRDKGQEIVAALRSLIAP